MLQTNSKENSTETDPPKKLSEQGGQSPHSVSGTTTTTTTTEVTQPENTLPSVTAKKRPTSDKNAKDSNKGVKVTKKQKPRLLDDDPLDNSLSLVPNERRAARKNDYSGSFKYPYI